MIGINIQASTFIDASAVGAIDDMPGYRERMERARIAVDAARVVEIPVVFVQVVHCLADRPGTALVVEQMGVFPSEYVVPKRRYSAFYGTDLEILLKGLKAETLILVGWADRCLRALHVRRCASGRLLRAGD